jgi:hypothetical protein
MKKLFALSLSVLLFTQACEPAWAALSDLDRSYIVGRNELTNPGFEASTAGWASTGGSWGGDSTAAHIHTGRAAANFDSSSAAQVVSSGYKTIAANDGYASQNGVVSCYMRCATGTCTHLLEAFDGTNKLVSKTITSSATVFQRTDANFPFPASGTVRLQITSVAANEPALYVDDCYLGLADGFNLSQISQASFYGSLSQAGATSCNHSVTNTGGENTWVTLAGASGCSAWSASGSVTNSTANTLQIVAADQPPGEYMFEMSANWLTNGTGRCNYRLSDGTNTFHMGTVQNSNASSMGGPTLVAHASYTTGASRTFVVQAASSGNFDCGAFNDTVGRQVNIRVYRYPTQAQQAVNSNLNQLPTIQTFTSGSGTYTKPSGVSYIRVRMVGGGGGGGGSGNSGGSVGGNGGDTTFGSSLLSAGGGVGGGSWTTNNAGSGGSASLGTGPIGTALSGATGIASEFGQVVTVAEINGGAGGNTALGGGGSGGHESTAALAGKTNTGAGGGGGGVTIANAGGGGGGGAGGYVDALINNPSATYAYAVGAAGSAGSAGSNSASAAATGGSGYIEVTEYYGAFNAPLLVGSVTSNSTGAERVERLKITNSTSVATQSGSWASVSNNGTGRAAVTITSGVFSATPTCVCTSAAANSASSYCQVNGLSGTTFEARTRDGGDSLTNEDSYVICMGSR